jgi:hypothetical protein
MMNAANPTHAEAGPGHNRCCEPGVLEEIACRATGIEKQAAYNAEHAQELKDAQHAYAAARARYSKARHDATPLVAKARRDLDELVDRIRCQLDPDDLECLERAFAHVVKRLNRCGVHVGRCCEDCDIDDVEDCDPDDVPGRRARLERQVAEATACFARLIAEPGEPAPPPDGGTASTASGPGDGGSTTSGGAVVPTAGTISSGAAARGGSATAATPSTSTATTAAATAATPSGGTTGAGASAGGEHAVPLPQRVADLRAEIDAIAKALAEGSAEATELYAAVLVARRHLDTVWQGFGNVNEYMECLCRSLTCRVTGHGAISVLVRKEAVHECYRDSWRKACKRLADETAAEVMAEYLRICSEDEGGSDEEYDDEHNDEGEGGHHHGAGHHRHDRDRRLQQDHDDGSDTDIETDTDTDGNGNGNGERRRPRPQGRPSEPPADDDRPPRRAPRPRPRRPYTDESGGYQAP